MSTSTSSTFLAAATPRSGPTRRCGSCARPVAACPSTGRCAGGARSSTRSSSPTWRPRSRCSRCAATASTPPCCTATSSCRPTPSGFGIDVAPGTGPVAAGAAAARPPTSPGCAPLEPDDIAYVAETVERVVAELGPDVPVLAFAGAPFTVASYLIEGAPSRTYEHTKALMHTDERAVARRDGPPARRWRWRSSTSSSTAGAQAFQLFDSWAGTLAPGRLRALRAAALAAGVRRARRPPPDVPGIHFGIGCDHLLEAMWSAGPQVMGLDWRTSITGARQRLGADVVVQGNLDPALVLAGATDRPRRRPARCSPTTAATPATSSTSATACTRRPTRACWRPSSTSSTSDRTSQRG